MKSTFFDSTTIELVLSKAQAIYEQEHGQDTWPLCSLYSPEIRAIDAACLEIQQEAAE